MAGGSPESPTAPLLPQVSTEPLSAYLVGNYNGLLAKSVTPTNPATTYYLTLPSILLQDISSPETTELTNQATQSGNLVLHKK